MNMQAINTCACMHALYIYRQLTDRQLHRSMTDTKGDKVLLLSQDHLPQSPQDILRAISGWSSSAGPTGKALERDVYGKGASLCAFEDKMATYLGKEKAVFVVSGVMSQLIALKVHAERRGSLSADDDKVFACHGTSHLEIHENKAYEHLLGFSRRLVGDKHRAISYIDVVTSLEGKESSAVLAPDAIQQMPSTLILELPQRENGGQTVEWEDLVQIRAYTKKHGIKLHMDGARLYEIAPYYQIKNGKSVADITALFDSVYVSYYKGLGAMAGAMLLGDAAFIERAKFYIRCFGGNLYTIFPYSFFAEKQFDLLSQSFEGRYLKLKRVVGLISKALELGDVGDNKTTQCIQFVPRVPQCAMVHVYFKGRDQAAITQCLEEVTSELGVEVTEKLRKQVLDCETTPGNLMSPQTWMIELKMGPVNVQIDDSAFVSAYTHLHKLLLESL